MKIIGRSLKGYILEAGEAEVARCAGYSWTQEAPGYSRNRGEFLVGTEIDVTVTHLYLEKLRRAEAEVLKSEGLLRALADLIHSAVPSTIIPPISEEASATEATGAAAA